MKEHCANCTIRNVKVNVALKLFLMSELYMLNLNVSSVNRENMQNKKYAKQKATRATDKKQKEAGRPVSRSHVRLFMKSTKQSCPNINQQHPNPEDQSIADEPRQAHLPETIFSLSHSRPPRQ